MARALGAAMPLHRDLELHRNLPERRRVYAGLFDTYLEEARSGGFVLAHGLPELRNAAEAHLDRLGHPREARREGRTDATERIWTFTGMLAKNQRTAEQWQSCLDGLGMLADGVGRVTGPEHTMIPGMFKDLARFWGQTHHVRALGAYLLDIARIHGMPEGVMPSLRLRIEVGDKPLDVIVGPSAS